MHRTTFFRNMTVLVVLFLGLALATGASAEILIGFHAPLTGFAAADGKSSIEGAELAVEQVNAQGGIKGEKMKLVSYDDQADANQAVPIAKKLLQQDKVKIAVSGSYSAPTRACAGVFQEAKIPYISAYAIHPDITRAGNYNFRASFMGEVQGRGGAKLVGEIMGKKNVTLINLANDFGAALAAGFKDAAPKFGIKIISEYSYKISDRQFGSIIASVKKDNPDAIYASGYFFTAGPLVSQIRAAGLKMPVIGQEGYDSQQFINIAKEAAEGVVITSSLDRDSKSKVTQDFIRDFEKKFKTKTDMVAASSHTAIMIAADAIRRAGSLDPAKVRDAIASTKGLVVSTGVIKFNKMGEVIKAVQVQIVKDGNFRHFATIDDPVLLAPPDK
ncbi:MAG: ABC transporter substrate-binding protein [Thermodesulfobacteriota bacterium]